jgi:hypothetical protein
MDAPVERPPYSDGVGTIRALLIGAAMTVTVGWFALVGMMIW